MKKLAKMAIKSSLVAVASAIALKLIPSEKRRALQDKVDDQIDEKGDIAKQAAKRSAHKAFGLADEASAKVSKIESKVKATAND